MTTPGANSDEIASASFYLPSKLYRHRRHSCQLSGPPFADIVPNSGTWIAFVKARHSVEDPGITNAMSALSQKTIASTSDQCPLLPSKADVTLRHTALGGRNLTTATKFVSTPTRSLKSAPVWLHYSRNLSGRIKDKESASVRASPLRAGDGAPEQVGHSPPQRTTTP